jgi:hypothetical protein
MTTLTRLLLSLMLLCMGCTVTVAQLNPSPNLDLALTTQSLSLAMEDAVRDSLSEASPTPSSAATPWAEGPPH